MNDTVDDKPEIQPIPWPEWFIAAVGLILVVGNFTYLARRAVQEKKPPSFAAQVESVERTNQGFLVRVNVKNDGGSAVADLRLSSMFRGAEIGEVVIDYLPSHSNRRAAFFTEGIVDPDQVAFQFTSFTEP